jgi:IclR family transcriptional regulator, acetate operon repressor
MLSRNDDAVTDKDTGTLGKAIAVLQVIAASDTPMRFTDLLSCVSQPRGTLHRQVTNLIDEGLLSVNRDQTYELGLRFLSFASKTWSKNRFREIAEPLLQKLHDVTGETIHLGVLAGAEVVYLDKVESRQAVRMYSQIGNASPTYCTGVGKAALSRLSDDEVRERLAGVEFRQFTGSTLKNIDALIAQLHDIRTAGFAFDREEHEPGIHCVAAPVRSAGGSILAGVSVTAPSFRVSMRQLEDWAGEVCNTARAIEEEVSARLSPRA